MNAIHQHPSAAERIKFADWVPNVSGGLVVSKIPQRTDWNPEYNAELAPIAEDARFDYALSQIRFIGSYGADFQHGSSTFSTVLLAVVSGWFAGEFESLFFDERVMPLERELEVSRPIAEIFAA